MRTGKGAPVDTFQISVPAGVNIANRRYAVDETIGSVVEFCTFGTSQSGFNG